MPLFKYIKKKVKLGVIHFIGIGGIGMSGIAEVMHNLGYKVQGSDLHDDNYNVRRLRSYGIKVFKSHSQENIVNASYIVISSAIADDNVELQKAVELKIPVIKRTEMLAELMRFKWSISISGSHGKTTTTSLIACLFEYAGLNPTVINGGIINNKLTNAYVGESDYLIVEADESDATFIKIPSTIGVITNIDYEHIDYYQSFDHLVKAFKSFIINLPFYGFAVACIDHPVVRSIINTVKGRRIISYGIESDDANIKACNIEEGSLFSTFDVRVALESDNISMMIEKITIPIAGYHNILNGLAAIAVAVELDFGVKILKNGFSNFKGVNRRFTKIAEYKGADIIDDYAHHPIEIKATLKTAKTIAAKRKGKVFVLYQPHRYTRLASLFNDFVDSFVGVDTLFITDVYSAGELPIKGVNSRILVKEIRTKIGLNASYVSSFSDFYPKIISELSPNDLFLIMGAGSIASFSQKFLEYLKNC